MIMDKVPINLPNMIQSNFAPMAGMIPSLDKQKHF